MIRLLCPRSRLSGLAIVAHVVVAVATALVPVWAIVDGLTALSEARSLPAQAQRWALLLGHTGAVCALAAVLAATLGALLALLCVRSDMAGRRLLLALLTVGLCLPLPVGLVFVLAVVPLWSLSGSLSACGLLYGLAFTPIAAMMIGLALRHADAQLEEDALLTAAPRHVVWHVTLPQARWGIAGAALLVALLTAADFTVTDLLLVRTFAEEVYTQFALGRSRAVPLLTGLPLLVALVLVLIALEARWRLVSTPSAWHFGRRPAPFHLGRWRHVIGWGLLLLIGACLAAPAARVIQTIGSPAHLARGAWSMRAELASSLVCGACAAGCITVAAPGLAWALVRGGRWRWPLLGWCVLLLALPTPVAGVSLIELLDRPGWAGAVYDSPLVIVIAYVVRFLPVATVLWAVALRRIPPELEDVAHLDGCTWLEVQRHVYRPALRVEACAIGLIVFTLCLAEIGCTVLVCPPGWQTLSVRAFTLMHFGLYRDLAVVAVLGTILTAGCATLLTLLVRRAKLDRSF